MTEWHTNTGRPPRCERVHVELYNGAKPAESWSVGGKQPAKWSIDKPPHPHDIKLWKEA